MLPETDDNVSIHYINDEKGDNNCKLIKQMNINMNKTYKDIDNRQIILNEFCCRKSRAGLRDFMEA